MAQEFMGHTIKIGDRLFDTVDRMVTVVELFSDQILAEITSRGGRVQKTYGFNGVQSRRQVRTLYWQNPMVVEPHKDPVIWQHQKAIIEASSEEIGKLLGTLYKKNPELRPTNESITQAQATANATTLQQGQAVQQNQPAAVSERAVVAPNAERNAAFNEAVRQAQNKIEQRTGNRPTPTPIGTGRNQ